uniref:Uncharacterized protein n=1 Tax=viral metagenome TaxID=1070528 RepID=A0A6C0H4R5_9ZZZZ
MKRVSDDIIHNIIFKYSNFIIHLNKKNKNLLLYIISLKSETDITKWVMDICFEHNINTVYSNYYTDFVLDLKDEITELNESIDKLNFEKLIFDKNEFIKSVSNIPNCIIIRKYMLNDVVNRFIDRKYQYFMDIYYTNFKNKITSLISNNKKLLDNYLTYLKLSEKIYHPYITINGSKKYFKHNYIIKNTFNDCLFNDVIEESQNDKSIVYDYDCFLSKLNDRYVGLSDNDVLNRYNIFILDSYIKKQNEFIDDIIVDNLFVNIIDILLCPIKFDEYIRNHYDDYNKFKQINSILTIKKNINKKYKYINSLYYKEFIYYYTSDLDHFLNSINIDKDNIKILFNLFNFNNYVKLNYDDYCNTFASHYHIIITIKNKIELKYNKLFMFFYDLFDKYVSCQTLNESNKLFDCPNLQIYYDDYNYNYFCNQQELNNFIILYKKIDPFYSENNNEINSKKRKKMSDLENYLTNLNKNQKII